MTTLLSDLRYALRSLRSSPAFTGIALLCLALGIGVNTTMFSSFNAMFLRSLPFEEPDRLVAIEEVFESQGSSENEISYPNFLDWTSDADVFVGRAVYFASSFNLMTAGEAPEYVSGATVSAGLFDLLGIRPVLGRAFPSEADGPGREPLAVIGHSQLLTMRMLLAGPDYAESADRAAFVGRLTREVESLTGVRTVAVVSHAPLSGSSSSTVVAVEEREYAPGEQPRAAYRPVTEHYFSALRVPLISGRPFTAQEVGDTVAGPAIINDVAARAFWPGEDPLGKRVEVFGDMRTVLGVVPGMQQRDVDGRSESQIFLPYGLVALMASAVPTLRAARLSPTVSLRTE